MSQPQRKYYAIWKRIKERETVLLAVAPIFEMRVRRMVSKEKDMDKAFKLMNEHDEFSLVFEYNKEKQQLRISLKQRFGIEERIIA